MVQCINCRNQARRGAERCSRCQDIANEQNAEHDVKESRARKLSHIRFLISLPSGVDDLRSAILALADLVEELI